jgi:hypothetical protein
MYVVSLILDMICVIRFKILSICYSLKDEYVKNIISYHLLTDYGGRYQCVDTSPTSLTVHLWIYTAHCSVLLVYRTGHKEARPHCRRSSCWCLTGLVSWRVRTAAWCGRYCPTGVTLAGFPWRWKSPAVGWSRPVAPPDGRFPHSARAQGVGARGKTAMWVFPHITPSRR